MSISENLLGSNVTRLVPSLFNAFAFEIVSTNVVMSRYIDQLSTYLQLLIGTLRYPRFSPLYTSTKIT
jgi:hypothetical protein